MKVGRTGFLSVSLPSGSALLLTKWPVQLLHGGAVPAHLRLRSLDAVAPRCSRFLDTDCCRRMTDTYVVVQPPLPIRPVPAFCTSSLQQPKVFGCSPCPRHSTCVSSKVLWPFGEQTSMEHEKSLSRWLPLCLSVMLPFKCINIFNKNERMRMLFPSSPSGMVFFYKLHVFIYLGWEE